MPRYDWLGSADTSAPSSKTVEAPCTLARAPEYTIRYSLMMNGRRGHGDAVCVRGWYDTARDTEPIEPTLTTSTAITGHQRGTNDPTSLFYYARKSHSCSGACTRARHARAQLGQSRDQARMESGQTAAVNRDLRGSFQSIISSCDQQLYGDVLIFFVSRA